MATVLVATLLIALMRTARASDYPGTVSIWATMGQFSPDPVRIIVGQPYPSSLSSLNAGSPTSYNPPPPSNDESEAKLAPIYTWSWQVNYKSSEGATYQSAPSAEYAVNPIPPSSSPSASLVFVPKVPAYWQVQVTCYVTVTDQNDTSKTWNGQSKANNGPRTLTSYTFDITYTGPVAVGSSDSGTVVTNQHVAVHAGWPIQLGAKISPSDLATQFTWMINGAGGNGSAAINGFIVASDKSSAQVTALDPSTDTKAIFPDPANSPTMLQSYYYTSGGSFAASVAPANDTSIPYVMTTFNVAAPSTTLTAKYQYPAQLAPIGSGPAQWIYLQATQALPLPRFTSSSQAGIVFYHPFVHSQTFQGTSYFVQVYAWNHTYTGINGTPSWSTAGTGLDTSDPYGANMVNQPVTGDDEQEDGPQVTTDRNNQVNYSPVTVQDSPTMWVMYTPKAGGSIDVPLASCNWPWGGTATWNSATGAWAFTNRHPTAAGNASASTTHTYPTWAHVLTAPQEWPPLQ